MHGAARGPIDHLSACPCSKSTGRTHKGKTAVAAGSNLGLVSVNEDTGVTQRAAAAVTADNSLVGPAHGLHVDKFDGGQGLRLKDSMLDIHVMH
jgi:hypothetical protein